MLPASCLKPRAGQVGSALLLLLVLLVLLRTRHLLWVILGPLLRSLQQARHYAIPCGWLC